MKQLSDEDFYNLTKASKGRHLDLNKLLKKHFDKINLPLDTDEKITKKPKLKD